MVSERQAGDAAEAKRRRSGVPRFLFVFRGRRSLEPAGSRSKNSGPLEFWIALAAVVALIGIVVLVCLRMVAAS